MFKLISIENMGKKWIIVPVCLYRDLSIIREFQCCNQDTPSLSKSPLVEGSEIKMSKWKEYASRKVHTREIFSSSRRKELCFQGYGPHSLYTSNSQSMTTFLLPVKLVWWHKDSHQQQVQGCQWKKDTTGGWHRSYRAGGKEQLPAIFYVQHANSLCKQF